MTKNRLKFILSECSIYIFHMLSVSKISYDNTYGCKYSNLHSKSDIKVLNNYKKHLTVDGGENCGELYVLLVSMAASYTTLNEMKVYYQTLNELFSTRDIKKTYPKLRDRVTSKLIESDEKQFEFMKEILNLFEPFSDAIVSITEVLIRNLSVFEIQILEKEKEIIKKYNNSISQSIIKYGDIMNEWEQLLHAEFNIPKFEIIIVPSIDGGAQAININSYQDVFGMYNDYNILISFISHEVGVYLIMEQLSDQIKNNLLKYWNEIESQACYLNEEYILKIQDEIGSSQYKEFYSDSIQDDMEFDLNNLIINSFKAVSNF